MRERGCDPHYARHASWLVAALLCATALLLFVPVAHGARATHEWANAPRAVEGLSVLRQQGRFDCGPALLATLARWAGVRVSLADVLASSDVGPTGMSLAEFSRVAGVLGISGGWYEVPRSRLGEVPAPFVAHFWATDNLGHYVAVVSLGHGLAVVADPARGAVVGGAAQLLGSYSGRAFLFDARPEPAWEHL